MSEKGGYGMKKRDFLAGFCCGAILTWSGGLDVTTISKFFAIALFVLILTSLWEGIKNATSANTGRKIILKRLREYTDNLVMDENK